MSFAKLTELEQWMACKAIDAYHVKGERRVYFGPGNRLHLFTPEVVRERLQRAIVDGKLTETGVRNAQLIIAKLT